MSTATVSDLMDPDDLLRLPDGDRYELLDGVPKEKDMGVKSGEIAGLLLTALNAFIRPRKLGRAYPGDAGYRYFPDRPLHVRFPDVSFVAAARVPGGRSPDGYYLLAPDLAVEVVSPHDLSEDVEKKVAEYRAAGVKLIWVISPAARTVLVRRPDGTCSELDEAGELSGEDVVPGFTCKVADLFV